MIMKNHNLTIEETKWEKIENKIKNSIFLVMYKLMHVQLYGSTVYRALIVIETI
jgi:hypothetical protein